MTSASCARTRHEILLLNLNPKIKNAPKALLQGALNFWLRESAATKNFRLNATFNIFLTQLKCWSNFHTFVLRNKLFDSIKAVLNAALN